MRWTTIFVFSCLLLAACTDERPAIRKSTKPVSEARLADVRATMLWQPQRGELLLYFVDASDERSLQLDEGGQAQLRIQRRVDAAPLPVQEDLATLERWRSYRYHYAVSLPAAAANGGDTLDCEALGFSFSLPLPPAIGSVAIDVDTLRPSGIFTISYAPDLGSFALDSASVWLGEESCPIRQVQGTRIETQASEELCNENMRCVFELRSPSQHLQSSEGLQLHWQTLWRDTLFQPALYYCPSEEEEE